MTDPALIGRLRILEAKLDRLTAAVEYVGNMLEQANTDHDPYSLKRIADVLEARFDASTAPQPGEGA